MTVASRIFGQPSARVVGLARVGLAAVFLAGTLADRQSTAGAAGIPVLLGYLAFAAIVAVTTWRDWWIDARIAIACHVIDIIFFVAVIGAPGGYSSPYFLFFVFLLLSPAIRWTWRETALTASFVVSMYVAAGLAFGLTGGGPFDERRFIIRSGYLLILSLMLIWFGVRQRFSIMVLSGKSSANVTSDASPLVAAVGETVSAVESARATGLWLHRDGTSEAVEFANGEFSAATPLPIPDALPQQAFLFDMRRDRALLNGALGRSRFKSANELLGTDICNRLADQQGIAIPVANTLGFGIILLTRIRALHSDHLPIADRLRSEVSAVMERLALFSALRDTAIARERVALARDLHDGVVQFLAGSSYRLEAISRSSGLPPADAKALRELKQLMLTEQEDLRSSISMLRRDHVDIDDLVSSVEALCERLGRQWRTECDFTCDVPLRRVAQRTQMDLLNIIKEAVANAVRHASASSVRIHLSASNGQLELSARNSLQGLAEPVPPTPWSISERVSDMGGKATMTIENAEAVVRVTLPFREEAE